jgi:hypothetical protein
MPVTHRRLEVPLARRSSTRRLDEPQVLLGPLSLPVLRSFPKAGRPATRRHFSSGSNLIFATSARTA